MTAAVICEDFKSVVGDSLRGFVKVRFPSGMIISEVAVHVRGGRAWAQPPARQMIGRDGTVMRDENGKQRWQPLIEFSNKAVRDTWSSAVIQAVHSAHPDALQGLVREDEP